MIGVGVGGLAARWEIEIEDAVGGALSGRLVDERAFGR